MVNMSLWLSLSLTWLTFVGPVVTGLPYFYINSNRQRCVVATVAKDTILRVHYEAPDLITDKEDPSFQPTHLSILERPVDSPTPIMKGLDPANKKNKLHGRKNKPTTQELVEQQGRIDHKMVQDAEVDICIMSKTAGKGDQPHRFALRLEELGGDEEKEEQSEENKGADHHLSHLETEMKRIEYLIHTMQTEANLSKDRDSIYHSRTDAMHQATIYWPIMHVGILLITGFAQTNHIVRFFRKRRII